MTVRILTGDCRSMLATLPAASVQCVVTSPPYYGLRDYGHGGQIGLEASPAAYIAEMVAVFREVRRVLRDDGTVWLNIGDSYASTAPGTMNGTGTGLHSDQGRISYRPDYRGGTIKPKDLIGIPWRVAFALQDDGWYLRQDIIWAKPSPMPESVTDRCTKAHEYVFLLTKRPRYFYDAAAVAEEAVEGTDLGLLRGRQTTGDVKVAWTAPSIAKRQAAGVDSRTAGSGMRNRRSVWTIASQPFAGSHFATMPPALAEICIKAGSSEKGQCPHCGTPWTRQVARTPMVLARSDRTHDKGHTRSSGTMLEPPRAETTGWAPTCSCPPHDPISQTILDPFGGAGTTGLVADRLGRNATLIELNPEYADMARRRIEGDAGLFAEVSG